MTPKNALRTTLPAGALASAVNAQTAPTIDRVVNSVNNTPTIAIASDVTVYGKFPVTEPCVSDNGSDLPKTLCGITITVNGIEAPIRRVAGDQARIIIPDTTGDAVVRASNGLARSNDLTTYVNYAAPAIHRDANGIAAITTYNQQRIALDNPLRTFTPDENDRKASIFYSGCGWEMLREKNLAIGQVLPEESLNVNWPDRITIDGEPVTILDARMVPGQHNTCVVDVNITQQSIGAKRLRMEQWGQSDETTDIVVLGEDRPALGIHLTPLDETKKGVTFGGTVNDAPFVTTNNGNLLMPHPEAMIVLAVDRNDSTDDYPVLTATIPATTSTVRRRIPTFREDPNTLRTYDRDAPYITGSAFEESVFQYGGIKVNNIMLLDYLGTIVQTTTPRGEYRRHRRDAPVKVYFDSTIDLVTKERIMNNCPAPWNDATHTVSVIVDEKPEMGVIITRVPSTMPEQVIHPPLQTGGVLNTAQYEFHERGVIQHGGLSILYLSEYSSIENADGYTRAACAKFSHELGHAVVPINKHLPTGPTIPTMPYLMSVLIPTRMYETMLVQAPRFERELAYDWMRITPEDNIREWSITTKMAKLPK